jgi:hypothetical protein
MVCEKRMIKECHLSILWIKIHDGVEKKNRQTIFFMLVHSYRVAYIDSLWASNLAKLFLLLKDFTVQAEYATSDYILVHFLNISTVKSVITVAFPPPL